MTESTQMLELVFAIGRAVSMLVLFFGAYLAIAEAIDTADSSDEDLQ
jgi:hypothetical protein